MNDPLQLLPHGPSFRFIDAMEALVPGKSGSACYLLRGDEGFLSGHFPGNPIMPGVLMIEAVAQLGGVVAQSDTDIPALGDLRLTAVQNAKILGTASPGATIKLTAEVLGRMDGLVMIHGQATVDGQVILTARVTLSGVPASRG